MPTNCRRKSRPTCYHCQYFVDKQTAKALAEGNTALVSVLISINRNVAEGLRGPVEVKGAASLAFSRPASSPDTPELQEADTLA
ncbi:MAG: hypothetical protein FD149_698 [Rhodospirillaceae bacterium]|nr:MAG: hypothetical protein FD149_698 [Rhodospirillaceae bacterium]